MGILVVLALLLVVASSVFARREMVFTSALLEEGAWVFTGGAVMVYASTFQNFWIGLLVFILGTLVVLTRPRKIRDVLEEEEG